jgi:hypothetical protein
MREWGVRLILRYGSWPGADLRVQAESAEAAREQLADQALGLAAALEDWTSLSGRFFEVAEGAELVWATLAELRPGEPK